jgi:hypothetical protein
MVGYGGTWWDMVGSGAQQPQDAKSMILVGYGGIWWGLVHNSPKTQKAPPTGRLFLDPLS